MQPLHYLAWLFGGLFLTNAVPHTVAALMGRSFQSPFAKPPGVGLSSSTVNMLWGAANLALAWLMLARVGAFDIRRLDCALSLFLPMLLGGLFLSRRFGRINGGNDPTA
jgi:hypothetical protein